MRDQWNAQRASKALYLALGMAAVYLVFGVAWILASDAVIESISADPHWLRVAQRYKGLFYIGITTAALVALLRCSYLRLMDAHDAAQSRELQVQDLFQRHPQPMWIYDLETLAFLAVNTAAVHDYGFTEEEFLRMTLRDIKLAQDVEALERQVETALPRYRDAGNVRHRKKSGEIVYVRVTAHAVSYAGRDAVMVMAIDVTSEAVAASALKLQESQYRQLHQSLGEVLWLASAEGGRIVYVSPAFESIFGRRPEELVADPHLWAAMVHPEDAAIAAASHDRLRTLGHAACEYRICRPDGQIRWIADRKKAIVDDEGRVTMIGGIAEDVSALKERDAARATTQAELERMVAERTAELEQANAELDAFARTAAHDLKSPLHAIVGFSALLRTRHAAALGTDGVGMAAMIERSAQHMASLVDDLLELSRVAGADIEPQPVDLAGLARTIVAELRIDSPQRWVQFEAPPKIVAHCDAGLARSLLTNLIGNAWKFTGTRPDARIRLTAAVTADGTEVQIADNGVGFDSATATDLFKPFQRFHTASEFAGTGIGLVTCQRIIQRHGGRISVSSTPGVGTKVQLMFPVRKPQPQTVPSMSKRP